MAQNKRVQLGTVSHGDFQEKTLTFDMKDEFYIQGGSYALVKLNDFQKLKRALMSCKMSMQAHPDNVEDSEFEGFVSLADEVLTELDS